MYKLFVGNFPYEIEEDELKELFETYGQVNSLRIVRDRETKRSRGFGFVTFEETDAAENALKELHGHDIGGRKLRVDHSHSSRGSEKVREIEKS